MARLSKAQAKAHSEAVELLARPRLSDDERLFVLDHWQESANHINSAAAAFFTPFGLARDTAIYTSGARTVLDLCAGIGCLGLASYWAGYSNPPEVTCVEINPDYIRAGQKLFPEARWIEASANDLPDLGRFDCVISNPPFGRQAKIQGPRFSGEDDLAIVDIASDLAEWGVFILPAMSCPFEYSGKLHYQQRPSAKYTRFLEATAIELSCESTDCAYHRQAWRGVNPAVEVASADFAEARAARAAKCDQPSLFSEAA